MNSMKNKIIILTRESEYTEGTEMYKSIKKSTIKYSLNTFPRIWIENKIAELSGDIEQVILNSRIGFLNSLGFGFEFEEDMVGDAEKIDEYKQNVLTFLLSKKKNNPYLTFNLIQGTTEYEVTLLLWNRLRADTSIQKKPVEAIVKDCDVSELSELLWNRVIADIPIHKKLVEAIINDCDVSELSKGCHNYLYIHDKQWIPLKIGEIEDIGLEKYFHKSVSFMHKSDTFFDYIKSLEIPCEDNSFLAELESEMEMNRQ